MPTVNPHASDPTLREQTIQLAERLDRIAAAATTLRALIFEIRHDVPPEPMVPLLAALDRDLVLASHELEQVSERAARELASLQ
jgi:hypothetical protein